MGKAIAFLTALVRFLWPFANARTREVVGTIVVILGVALGVAQAYYGTSTVPSAAPVAVPADVIEVVPADAIDAVEDSAGEQATIIGARPVAIEVGYKPVPAPDAPVPMYMGLLLPAGLLSRLRRRFRVRGTLLVLACIAAFALPVGCAGPLNATQLKYATIGKETASDLFNLCGLKWAEGAMEGNGIAKGTANGDEALACLTRVAIARGLQVVVEVAQDVATGATGGGWFGSAEQTNSHTTVYTVRVVRAVQ